MSTPFSSASCSSPDGSPSAVPSSSSEVLPSSASSVSASTMAGVSKSSGGGAETDAPCPRPWPLSPRRVVQCEATENPWPSMSAATHPRG
eukprot:5890431-Alexandrium_andersonii.AAC.1